MNTETQENKTTPSEVKPILIMNNDFSFINNSESPDQAISMATAVAFQIIDSTAKYFESIKESNDFAEIENLDLLSFDELKEAFDSTFNAYRMMNSGFSAEETMDVLGIKGELEHGTVIPGTPVKFDSSECPCDICVAERARAKEDEATTKKA